MAEIVVALKEKGKRRPASEMVTEVAEKLREDFDKSTDIRLKRFRRRKEKLILEYDGIVPEGDAKR